MTQPIERSKFQPNKVLSPGSRYQKSVIVHYGEQKILTLELYVRANYISTGKEKVTVITKGYEYRPDLVSYEYYGHVDNWWKIMEANRIKDIWDFKAGTTIMLPDQ